jgi:uncharacterized protein (DUF2252 family)
MHVRDSDPTAPRASLEERRNRGKEARRAVPRSAHAAWAPGPERVDPIAVLEAEAASRLAALVPIRHGRMLASPYSFYRGAAAVMAADLALTAASGLRVQACGDAHPGNFGLYGSPERELVFDLNDFDETQPAPWEWDVKRLATGFVVGARGTGAPDAGAAAALAAVRAYREAMLDFAGRGTLEIWYAHMTSEDVRRALHPTDRARPNGHRGDIDAVLARAVARTSHKAMVRLTEVVDGRLRIAARPPLLWPVREGWPAELADLQGWVQGSIDEYRRSLPAHRRRLLDRYHLVDIALKVVGVGSVGLPALVVLCVGKDDDDPLVLQVKAAHASVLEPYAGRSRFRHHGRRVVEGQQLMQAVSGIFLGWTTGPNGTYVYVRQLWDMKGAVDLEDLSAEGLVRYAELCGWTLARAHARSGDEVAIAAYLGRADRFERAVADYQLFVEAVREGRLHARPEEGDDGPAA